jgi:hypothetical protein
MPAVSTRQVAAVYRLGCQIIGDITTSGPTTKNAAAVIAMGNPQRLATVTTSSVIEAALRTPKPIIAISGRPPASATKGAAAQTSPGGWKAR